MNEYIVLATQQMNLSDPDSEVCDWTVGTLEQAEYWYKKWEAEGYAVHIRKASHVLNAEHLFAGVPLSK
jgi:hypothetical protein